MNSEEDLEALITPDQVEKYERSESARNAIKLFSSFSKEPLPPLTRNDYCCMQDYLVFQLSIQNSHRSGVEANMLVEEFQKATQEDDFMRIKVKHHKTCKVYGPAKVYLKKHIFNYLNIFATNVRDCLPMIKSRDHVFLSFNGLKMESGGISKQLNSIWRCAGVYEDMNEPPSKNITTTIFRKSISSAVLEHQPENAKSVAQLLAHSDKTQGKYYNPRRRDLSSAAGTHHVGNILRFGGKTEQLNSPKKIWSEVEVSEIRSIFKEELLEKQISIEAVDAKRKLFTNLQNVLSRKIYDKVRSLTRYESSACNSPQILPVETGKDRCERLVQNIDSDPDYKPKESSDSDSSDENESVVPPSTSGVSSSLVSGKEKIFPHEDVKELLKWCDSIVRIGPISKERI